MSKKKKKSYTTLDLLRTGQHPHSLMPLGVHTSSSSERNHSEAPSCLSAEHSHLCLQGARLTFILGRYVSTPCWTMLQLRLWDTTIWGKGERGMGRGKGEGRERLGRSFEVGKQFLFWKERERRRRDLCHTLTLLPAPNLPSQSPWPAPKEVPPTTTGSFGDSNRPCPGWAWKPSLGTTAQPTSPEPHMSHWTEDLPRNWLRFWKGISVTCVAFPSSRERKPCLRKPTDPTQWQASSLWAAHHLVPRACNAWW